MRIKDIDTQVKDLMRQRDSLLVRKQNISRNILQLDVKIATLESDKKAAKQNGLFVTNHAIDRFQERILDIPRQKVKSILTSEKLFQDYHSVRKQKYKVYGALNCIAVILDGVVVTVYSTIDPFYRVKMLGEYMNYWIDARVQQEQGYDVKILTFNKFLKLP